VQILAILRPTRATVLRCYSGEPALDFAIPPPSADLSKRLEETIPVESPGGESKPNKQERREHPRFKVAIQTELRLEGSSVPMRLHTADISIGGCYVETALNFEVATRLDMVLWLGEQKVVTKGVVVTKHPGFGNGIQFNCMSGQDQHRLGEFLDALEKNQA
jgi:hypothetical protein